MTTIVTAYFKLEISKASHDTYIQWMQNMLMIDNPMIIFCDKESEQLIQTFRENKQDKTHIILTDFHEFHSYRYIDTFEKHYERDHEQDIGHNVLLYLIWNEKSNFLKRAIEIDHFKTEYFLWVDIGCFREPNTRYIHYPKQEKIDQLPKNKVLLLSVGPFTQEELECVKKEDLPSFEYTYRIGGTIFGGEKDILLKWHTLYYDMLEYFITVDKFIGKDQNIMSSVYLLNKEDCNLVPERIDWFYFQKYLN